MMSPVSFGSDADEFCFINVRLQCRAYHDLVPFYLVVLSISQALKMIIPAYQLKLGFLHISTFAVEQQR